MRLSLYLIEKEKRMNLLFFRQIYPSPIQICLFDTILPVAGKYGSYEKPVCAYQPLKSFTASTICMTSSSVSSGYIGILRISEANKSVTGKCPAFDPSGKAFCRLTGTG
jgi:hypothetical protein